LSNSSSQSRALSLSFRLATAADLAVICQAAGHPENAPFITPWSDERYQAALTHPDEALWVVEARAEIAGFILLAGLTSPHRSIELRRLVMIHKGQGYGRFALDWAQRQAFEGYQAHRLWLDVKTNNPGAFRLYQRMGFVLEGTLRDSLLTSDGQYLSVQLMSMLRAEYEQRQAATTSASL
jgi:diamine N-acetyltransferase